MNTERSTDVQEVPETGFPRILVQVLEFFSDKFKALKVLENRTGA